ncbi:unnamed protein product [Thlaspi arvense]|uniref:MATH domain-containing protein n=1 Tax=Thlaspi arvense TaxID=13288 RepID=A0AAU9S8U6_THLAR|nr:unnamed protein product [Thlaspi arvense]
MWNQKPSFRFEIENFSEKENGVASHIFVSGGCEWFLNVWPKGHHLIGDHLAVYLYANRNSLGWKRTASYYYVALNQSYKELYRSPVELNKVFGAEIPGRVFRFPQNFNFSKPPKGCLENDKLIIELYIKVVESVDGDVSEKKEIECINGFHVCASQITLVREIFAEHPDIAQHFKPKNQVVKTEYMNVLLDLITTLNKPPHRISEAEISSAHSDLSELTDAGFKLEWLKTKIEEVSLKCKKSDDANGSRVQQLEERIKNLELMDLGSLNSKLEEISSERKKKADAEGSRVQQLEESVKNLELMVLDLKALLDNEKAKYSDAAFLLVNEVA